MFISYSCNQRQTQSAVSERRCKNESALIRISPCAQLYSDTLARMQIMSRAVWSSHTKYIHTLDAWFQISNNLESNPPHCKSTFNTWNRHQHGFGFCHADSLFFLVSTKLFILQPRRNRENAPSPVSLPHLMHTDKPRPWKKCRLSHEIMATNMDSHKNGELSDTIMFVFILKKQSDEETLSVLWLWDDHSRMSRLKFKHGRGASYPWIHYHLDDRNGCRLETKSLKLIQVSSNSCTDNVIFDLTHETVLPVSDANAPQTFLLTADMGCIFLDKAIISSS